MLSNIETLLFPVSLCGVPFANCNDTVVTDDETLESRECDETLEVPDSSQQVLTPTRTNSSMGRSENSKKVRFQIDDHETIRKRRQRNLRQTILQKSRSIHESKKREDAKSNSFSRSSCFSDRRKKQASSSHKIPSLRRGGRRKNFASVIAKSCSIEKLSSQSVK